MKKKIRLILVLSFFMLVVVSYAKTIKEYIVVNINQSLTLTSSEPQEIEIMHKKQKYSSIKKEQWKKNQDEHFYYFDILFNQEGIYEFDEQQIIVHQENQPLFTTNNNPCLAYNGKQVYLKQTEFYVLKEPNSEFKLMREQQIISPNKQIMINAQSYDYYFLTQPGLYEGFLDDLVVYDFYLTGEMPVLEIEENLKDSNFVKKENITFLRLNKQTDLTLTLSLNQKEVQSYLGFEPIIINLEEGKTDVQTFWPFSLETTHLYIIDNECPKLIGFEETKNPYYVKKMPCFQIEEPYLDEKNSQILQDGRPCKIDEIENRSSSLSFKLVDEARNRLEVEFEIIVDQEEPLLKMEGNKIRIVENNLQDYQLFALLNNENIDLQFVKSSI